MSVDDLRWEALLVLLERIALALEQHTEIFAQRAACDERFAAAADAQVAIARSVGAIADADRDVLRVADVVDFPPAKSVDDVADVRPPRPHSWWCSCESCQAWDRDTSSGGVA